MGGIESSTNKYYDAGKNAEEVLPEYSLSYFNTIKQILRSNYNTLDQKEENVLVSLERKSFTKAESQREDGEYVSWDDYIRFYLEDEVELQAEMKEGGCNWAAPMLEKFNTLVFLTENKYQSSMFFKEYLLETLPKILDKKEEDPQEEIEEKFGQFQDNQKNYFTELSITENLGGSFCSIDNDIAPEDPMAEYNRSRKRVKKYVHIMSDHITNNPDHPISVVFDLFVEFFSVYLNNVNFSLRDLQTKGEENFNEIANKKNDSVTKQMQKFILTMQTAIKLFYCNVADYSSFSEEKDELVNFVTGILFKKGKIYEMIYELYDFSCLTTKRTLEKTFVELNKYPAEKLKIAKKFCLDDTTLALQEEILKKKREERDLKNKEDQKKAELDEIKEGEGEEEEEEEKEKEKGEANKSTTKYLYENISLSGMNELNKSNCGVSPLYDKNNRLSRNSNLYQVSRNTVNNFNSKRIMNPKLHQTVRDSIWRQNQNIQGAMHNEDIPKSYSSAVLLLKSIKKYRTPFEKMLVIASISDEITYCVNAFWKNMEKYIKSTYLNIEADELMTIFLFIIIKSQMLDLIVFTKMIKNFTASTTRGTMLGYYYTTLEASIAYIIEVNDSKVLLKEEEDPESVELPNPRVSLARYSNLNFSQYI